MNSLKSPFAFYRSADFVCKAERVDKIRLFGCLAFFLYS